MVAKIKEMPQQEQENEDGAKKPRKPRNSPTTREEVLQALRQKCNQLIFQAKRPSYFKGKLIV